MNENTSIGKVWFDGLEISGSVEDFDFIAPNFASGFISGGLVGNKPYYLHDKEMGFTLTIPSKFAERLQFITRKHPHYLIRYHQRWHNWLRSIGR